VRDELAAALRALADYTSCVGECDDRQVTVARRAFHIALENAEASLQRLVGDGPSDEVEALMSVTTYARRYALALSALAAATNDRWRLQPVTSYASAVLLAMAAGSGAEAREVPDEPAAERLLYALRAMERAAERLQLLEHERAVA